MLSQNRVKMKIGSRGRITGSCPKMYLRRCCWRLIAASKLVLLPCKSRHVVGWPRQLGGCVGRLPRNLQNFWHCLPRLADPMPAGIPSFFISTRDQASPGYVIFSDESSSNIGTMHFGVKLRAPLRAVLFEIIHPFENFLNATWQMRFHLCSASSCCDGTLTLSVYNEDLPVGLAFINETHCSKRPASDHIPNTGRCRADINHIQGVIIARSIVKFVVFGWITVCLWEASVVERNRSPEGSQPPRSFCVLTKNVVLEGGLEPCNQQASWLAKKTHNMHSWQRLQLRCSNFCKDPCGISLMYRKSPVSSRRVDSKLHKRKIAAKWTRFSNPASSNQSRINNSVSCQ